MRKLFIAAVCMVAAIHTISAQNVGINNTNPGYPLDINGRLRIRHNGATPGTWYNKADNSGPASFVGVINDTTFGIYDNPGGIWRFAFNHSNSNLGIGTLTPKYPLCFPDIIGDKISLWGGNTSSSTAHYGMGIQGSLMQFFTNASNADIAFGYGSSYSFTERMRIKGTGNVGIGTNLPDARLEVRETGSNPRAAYFWVNSSTAGAEALRVESLAAGNGAALVAYRNGNGNAILASSLSGAAVDISAGSSSSDIALRAVGSTAVYGMATASGGYGVRASNNGILGATALWAEGYSLVSGNLQVIGTLSKSAGTFKIDHPQDPGNKFLVHSFVESPDMMNVYNGNTQTDANGFATVKLPPYFEAENIDFKYQLTIIGKEFAQALVYEKIKDNQFIIRTDKPGIEVSWQVTGVRNDKYAQQNRIVPEVDKNENEKGKYLNPELFGFSKDKQLLPVQ